MSRMEISFQREHFLTHGLKNTGNKSINGVIRGFQESRNRHRLLDGRDLYHLEFREQAGVAAGAQDWKSRTLVGNPQYRKAYLWYIIFVINCRLPREPIPKILVICNQLSVLLVAAS